MRKILRPITRSYCFVFIYKYLESFFAYLIIFPTWLKLSLKYGRIKLRFNRTDGVVFKSVFIDKDIFIPDIENVRFIIDAGAYAGFTTLFFAINYPEAKILAIEPEKNNFETLTKNVRMFSNVEVINAALWHENKKLYLDDRNTGDWGFQVKENKSENHVSGTDSVTVQDLLNISGMDKIDIFKIDIEGSEKYLFENSSEWINNVRVIFLELHDRIVEGCTETLKEAIDHNLWNYEFKGEKVLLIKK